MLLLKKAGIGLIVIVALVGACFFIDPFSSFEAPTSGNLVYSFSCGSVSFEYREYLSINKIEGSSARYAFVYKKDGNSIDIPVTARGFVEEGQDSGYVQSASLLDHTPFPFVSFGSAKDPEFPSQIIIIDPSKFTRSDFEEISSCFRKNVTVLYSSYEKYIADSTERNRRLNLYTTKNYYSQPGVVSTDISFAGAAYVDLDGFLSYSNQEYKRSH